MAARIAGPVVRSLELTVVKSFLVMLKPVHTWHLSSVKVELAFTIVISSFLVARLQVTMRIAHLQVKSISQNREFRLMYFFEVILWDFS